MIYLLLGLIIILILWLVKVHFDHYQLKKQIDYIQHKLHEINQGDERQYLKLYTESDEMKDLLIQLNQLLERKYIRNSKYNELELSIKQMVSNLSHDLKTPLTVILGYVESELTHEGHSIQSRNNLTKVHEKGTELLTLINRFFELAKLESQDTSVELVQLDIVEVIRKNIGALHLLIQQYQVTVDIQLPNESIMILSNEECLNRILTNLITNCLQYGSSGGYFGLKLLSTEDTVEISIIDKGQGIPKNMQAKIFQRSFTLEHSRNRAYQGSGLGLSITKHLVHKLNGSIELESYPNKLTQFIVKFRM